MEIRSLVKEVRERFPTKTVWLYTGYEWEVIRNFEVMRYIDVVVDGEYVKEKRDAQLHWRGSANQRVIDVPASLKRGNVVLYCD